VSGMRERVRPLEELRGHRSALQQTESATRTVATERAGSAIAEYFNDAPYEGAGVMADGSAAKQTAELVERLTGPDR
jgi:hypothetical protein